MSDSVPAPQKAQRIVPTPTLRFGNLNPPLALRLTEDDATLGRRPDNKYVVPDPRVSRVHAQINKQGAAVIVTDLGSSGGTRINGDDLDGPHVLAHGDTISFGGADCSFEDPAAVADAGDPTMVFEVPEVNTGPSLSPRQQQVIELIAEGMTNSEIGDQLGITERTVKAYAQELYDKLGVRNRAGAVAEAVKHGLL